MREHSLHDRPTRRDVARRIWLHESWYIQRGKCSLQSKLDAGPSASLESVMSSHKSLPSIRMGQEWDWLLSIQETSFPSAAPTTPFSINRSCPCDSIAVVVSPSPLKWSQWGGGQNCKSARISMTTMILWGCKDGSMGWCNSAATCGCYVSSPSGEMGEAAM